MVVHLSYRPLMKRSLGLCVALMLSTGACISTEPSPERVPPTAKAPGKSRRCAALPLMVQRVRRGYVRDLSPDINLIPREPNYVGVATSPVHSGPWDYLARVPLVIYGPRSVKPGAYDLGTTMADVAPTTAALIGFDGFDPPDGRVLEAALVENERAPRLVVTIVWDGGGWNVLSRHPDSHPFLDRLMDRSAVFETMEIGSSPSVTPPIHATLSTGVYPRNHGIPGLRIRTGDGYVDPFLGLDPSHMRVPTLADVYDPSTNNEAVTGMLAAVNWHLSMIGQGAGQEGGDRDEVVLFDERGVTYTNESLYSAPYHSNPGELLVLADELDAEDGTRDGEWRGHPLDDPQVRYASPAHVRFQQMLLERFIEAGKFGRDDVPDLLYTNFKPSDDAGHAWGMNSPETAATFKAQDDALRRLVSFLDRRVGKDRWALILTADHGQTPYPRESGAWAIGGGELARDANAALDRNDDEIPLVDRVSSPGAYLNTDQLPANDVTMREVGEWIAAYTAEQNLKDGAEFPTYYRGSKTDLLFDAVVIRDKGVVSEACE